MTILKTNITSDRWKGKIKDASCIESLQWQQMKMKVGVMLGLLMISGGLLFGSAVNPASGVPLRAHPKNPYILEFRGQPTVLRTYGEHYSSVLNTAFDYVPYLDVLQRDGMNLTRAFLVGFRLNKADPPQNNSPLSPAPAEFLQPWPRTTANGVALDGLGKWDLSVWNQAYFDRLNGFAQACSDRGIVAQLSLFCLFYTDNQWKSSPFNPANNVQGYGPANRYDAMRMVNANLLAVQEAVVQRIVTEVNRFDNIYFEVENEPYWNEPNVKDDQEVAFHNRMLNVIRTTEAGLPNRHLVAHDFPQQSGALSSGFDMINEHYPMAVAGSTIAGADALLRDQYSRGRILALDETDTTSPVQTRLECWMFILGGGGIYNGLDVPSFVYTAADETGDNEFGKSSRKAIRDLGTYISTLHLVALRRNLSWLTGGIPAGATLQAMACPGEQYVAYLHHGSGGGNFQLSYNPINTSNHTAALRVALAQGRWRAVWTRPSDLTVLKTEEFTHSGGTYNLAPVVYQEDVALRIDKVAEPPAESSSLFNGSFESGFSGWSIGGNQLIQSVTPYSATHGSQLVVFNSQQTAPNGVLSQIFATDPGQSYFLTFDMGILSFSTGEQRLQVEVDGNSVLSSKIFAITGTGNGTVRWLSKSVTFTADSESTSLTFRDTSQTTSQLDLLLDHANIVPLSNVLSVVPDLSLLEGVTTLNMTAPEPGLYELQRSRDLATWEFVDQTQMAEPGVLELSDDVPPESTMFYRIVLRRPE